MKNYIVSLSVLFGLNCFCALLVVPFSEPKRDGHSVYYSAKEYLEPLIVLRDNQEEGIIKAALRPYITSMITVASCKKASAPDYVWCRALAGAVISKFPIEIANEMCGQLRDWEQLRQGFEEVTEHPECTWSGISFFRDEHGVNYSLCGWQTERCEREQRFYSFKDRGNSILSVGIDTESVSVVHGNDQANFPLPYDIPKVVLSCNGDFCAVWNCSSEKIQIFSIKKGKMIDERFVSGFSGVRCLYFSRDGNYFCCGGITASGLHNNGQKIFRKIGCTVPALVHLSRAESYIAQRSLLDTVIKAIKKYVCFGTVNHHFDAVIKSFSILSLLPNIV
jgi:hypothetical protein